MDVLVCLAGNAGNVTERDTLLREVWGNAVVSDEPLTRCIATLRKELGDDPQNPTYIQTVPKRGYRMICPVSLPADSAKLRIRVVRTGVAALVVVTMAIAAYVWIADQAQPLDIFVEGSVRTEVLANSVAVLPFSNLSGDPDQEYFSDGITEDISSALARAPELHVTSRTSTFSLKGSNNDIPSIANQLGVAYVVDGSVRRSGDKVRISAQLIEVASDKQIWSFTYDRQFDDIFAMQDEVSRTVVNRLQTALDLEPTVVERLQQSVSAEAYELYLRGLQLFHVGTVEARLRAEQHFLHAIELEPDFANAWYRLARTRYALPKPKYATVVSVLAAANKAIDLNPRHGAAHTLVSIVAPLWNSEKLEVRARAMEMSPNDPWVVLNYGRALEWNYRVHEADEYFRKAIRLDPLNVETRRIYGLFNMFRGRSRKALNIFDQIIESNPDYAPAYQHRSRVFSDYLGDMVSSRIAMDRALSIDPETINGVLGAANIYFAVGDLDAAGEMVDRIARSGTEEWRIGAFKARYQYLLGEHDKAVRIARELFEQRGPGFTDPTLMLIVVRDMIAKGKLGEAEEFLLTYEPDFERLFTESVPRTKLELISRLVRPQFASMLHHVYKLQGKNEQAADLAERIRTDDLQGALTRDFEPTVFSYHTDALKRMRDGSHAHAIEALRFAVDSGYRVGYQQFIRDHPEFAELHAYPEFQEILQNIEDDMAAQRQTLSSMTVDHSVTHVAIVRD